MEERNQELFNEDLPITKASIEEGVLDIQYLSNLNGGFNHWGLECMLILK